MKLLLLLLFLLEMMSAIVPFDLLLALLPPFPFLRLLFLFPPIQLSHTIVFQTLFMHVEDTLKERVQHASQLVSQSVNQSISQSVSQWDTIYMIYTWHKNTHK